LKVGLLLLVTFMMLLAPCLLVCDEPLVLTVDSVLSLANTTTTVLQLVMFMFACIVAVDPAVADVVTAVSTPGFLTFILF
jgi:hypothetical protein